MRRGIIESLRVTIKISVTTYELPSSTISSFFLSPITAGQARCPKFGQPRHARRGAHACTRAIDIRRGALPALWTIVSPIFGTTIARGPRWAGSSYDPDAHPGSSVSFLSRERGHVTPGRRRNRRLPGSNPAVRMCGVWFPVFASGPGVGVRATPRKAMECARPPGRLDGWLCLCDLTSRSESRCSILARRSCIRTNLS